MFGIRTKVGKKNIKTISILVSTLIIRLHGEKKRVQERDEGSGERERKRELLELSIQRFIMK